MNLRTENKKVPELTSLLTTVVIDIYIFSPPWGNNHTNNWLQWHKSLFPLGRIIFIKDYKNSSAVQLCSKI